MIKGTSAAVTIPFSAIARPAKVRKLMLDHIDEARGLAGKLDAAARRHFVFDSELQARISPQQQSSKPGKTR